MISKYIALGKRMYRTHNPREFRRMVVFIFRALFHNGSMQELMAFFSGDRQRRELIDRNPYPMEQVTRSFFYKGSTFGERMNLIKNHYLFLQNRTKPEWFSRLAELDRECVIWRYMDEELAWETMLNFETGQRKEGLLALDMRLKGKHLYQIMFWFNKDKNDEDALWIGAMQGPNTDNAREIIKETTKLAHRYRTKNLILYMTMAVARSFGCQHIYAVSNEGYYANNHVRRDRKLKTDFGAFWEEPGGHITEDPRFYEIPLREPRKTMEEVPTRKRATYRKRFAFQDDVDEQIGAHIKEMLRDK
jgi:hypothetical protein